MEEFLSRDIGTQLMLEDSSVMAKNCRAIFFMLLRSWQVSEINILVCNVVKTITNHPFGNCFYHLFIVILGMVYNCFSHITEVGSTLQNEEWRLKTKNRRNMSALKAKVDALQSFFKMLTIALC